MEVHHAIVLTYYIYMRLKVSTHASPVIYQGHKEMNEKVEDP